MIVNVLFISTSCYYSDVFVISCYRTCLINITITLTIYQSIRLTNGRISSCPNIYHVVLANIWYFTTHHPPSIR